MRRLNFFVVQYFFIVVAPVFFSAAVYLLFLRALRLADGHKARIRPRYCTPPPFAHFSEACGPRFEKSNFLLAHFCLCPYVVCVALG